MKKEKEEEEANLNARRFSYHFLYRFAAVISRYLYEATALTAAAVVSHL